MDPNISGQGKGLNLPKPTIDQIAKNARFLVLSLPNNEMSKKSPFAIQKALLGISGEPKSVKKLKSGDLLVETNSGIQSKSFLSAKTFLDCPLTVTPHKTLNSCRGVISESDLMYTPETEILEGFSGQGVIQVRRITIKKDAILFPTKHLILTFNNPKLPNSIKAGYLNCKIRPYVPNPLRCFKCQRFGHSQTSCRGKLTCSRCASVEHSSIDCKSEPNCVNCSQPHTSDSKLCPKWKMEKQIQEIKINKNISYPEARKLVNPLTQTYAQATKPTSVSSRTQTDEKITKIVCPPLQCLKPLSSRSNSKPTTSSSQSVPLSCSSIQANLLTSVSSIEPTASSELKPSAPIVTATSTSSKLQASVLSSIPSDPRLFPLTCNKFAALLPETQSSSSQPQISVSTSNSSMTNIPQTSDPKMEISTVDSQSSILPQSSKLVTKNRSKKQTPKKASKSVKGKPIIEIKMAPRKPKKSIDSIPSAEYDDRTLLQPDQPYYDSNHGCFTYCLTPTKSRKK